MSSQDWDRANFKPDLTDKQLSSVQIRSQRLPIQTAPPDSVDDSQQISVVPVFVRDLKIKAERNNKGIVYIGSQVSNDLRVNGYPLSAGEELSLPINDLSIVWYQGDTSGDFFRIIYSY